jgi:hypothetical protein
MWLDKEVDRLMSDAKTPKEIKDIQDDAKFALYSAAKEAADYVKAVLEEREITNPKIIPDKNRLDAALKLLEIAFSKSS